MTRLEMLHVLIVELKKVRALGFGVDINRKLDARIARAKKLEAEMLVGKTA